MDDPAPKKPEPSDAEIAAACRWLDERWPSINTRFAALMYARQSEEHARGTLVERVVETARALGWPGLPQSERTYTRSEALAYGARVRSAYGRIAALDLAALLDESRKP